jgi:hypothetical protein
MVITAASLGPPEIFTMGGFMRTHVHISLIDNLIHVGGNPLAAGPNSGVND